jgi:hypothetical protein
MGVIDLKSMWGCGFGKCVINLMNG